MFTKLDSFVDQVFYTVLTLDADKYLVFRFKYKIYSFIALSSHINDFSVEFTVTPISTFLTLIINFC